MPLGTEARRSLVFGPEQPSPPGCNRLNIQHRLVYQVLPDERVVKVLRLWTHFE